MCRAAIANGSAPSGHTHVVFRPPRLRYTKADALFDASKTRAKERNAAVMSRANQSVKKLGADRQSVPYLGVQRRRTARSGASERNRDELCLIVGLHAHEHGM